ncbi:unnamed protein product [Closterium sp. NIES-64]|nr:unnamed protein product [Closterium sp. NIES-64]
MASSHDAGANLSHFDTALLVARLLGQNPLRGEAAAADTILSHCRRSGSGGSGEDHFSENATLASISSSNANPIARGGASVGGERGGAFSGSPAANKEEKAESYQWKKYGHKFLSSQNAKRFYYHCVERDTTGCPAKLIIDKVPKKKKSKHGRRAELKDFVAAREVPGSTARQPPVDGAAVVGADRESGSPRIAVAGWGEKGENSEDSDFGCEENREILDALPVLERRVDRTLTPRRFWCRNRHNHLPPPQQPLHMIVSAAAVAQPRMHVASAAAGASAAAASTAATLLPPPPPGIFTAVPPAATLTPTVAPTASATSGAANAGGGGETPRGPLTPNLEDWPLAPKSHSPPVGPSSPEPATAGLERGFPPCGFPPRGLRPSGYPPCAHAGRKRARSPVARGAAADNHHKIAGWDRGSAMMTRRRPCSTAGRDRDVLAVRRGDSALHSQPPPPAAPGPSNFQYSFPPLGAFNARSTREAPLLSALLDTLRPTTAAAAAATADAHATVAAAPDSFAAAAARDSSAAAGARPSAGGYDGGLLGGIAGAQSPAAEVSLTAHRVFPRGACVSSVCGDPTDAGTHSAWGNASDGGAATAGANAATAEAAGDPAPGKAEEGFETLWSYVEANLRHRVTSQGATAAAAAAATAAAAPLGLASLAAGTARSHGFVMNEIGNVQRRLAASLPRGLLGLAEEQRTEAMQQAEKGAHHESSVLHVGSSCPVLPPLSSSIPAASATAAAADGGVGTGMAGRRFEEIQALYIRGLLCGQGLVGSGGEGLMGMERRSTEKKTSVFAGQGPHEMEGRSVCVDDGNFGLREAGEGGGGGGGGGMVAQETVEMDLIGQLGDPTASGRQAGSHGAPQVLSTELCL